MKCIVDILQRDLSYGILYTWGLFMPAVRIVKVGNHIVGEMFDVCCSFLYISEKQPVRIITS